MFPTHTQPKHTRICIHTLTTKHLKSLSSVIRWCWEAPIVRGYWFLCAAALSGHLQWWGKTMAAKSALAFIRGRSGGNQLERLYWNLINIWWRLMGRTTGELVSVLPAGQCGQRYHLNSYRSTIQSVLHEYSVRNLLRHTVSCAEREQSATRGTKRSERAERQHRNFDSVALKWFLTCTVHDANRCRFIYVSLWTARVSLSTFVKVGFKNNEGRSHFIMKKATRKKTAQLKAVFTRFFFFLELSECVGRLSSTRYRGPVCLHHCFKF